ncbi:hypothetical protein BASA50_009218 [Batrachochytrium salamandrivorans]|uniref:Uncharacterized protein n=1 Tax=Batrachochytrium salamandrivorans TaxID=1357716 RepID=A0ABQ8F339_9FUNG|nr:hypothetical protein BASA50_009218 [Batrachochytrium salamandrivorans]
MRVDTGIILSVLSFSVIAAVIPNGDDHGLLLVRRAVSPENRAVLWKRADEEQEGSNSSDSDTDGGGSSSNSPSRSRGSDKLSPFQSAARGVQLPIPKVFKGKKTSHTMQRDSKDIQKVITKLTQAVEGRQGKSAIDDIGKFLKISLESAKLLKNAYYSKVETPFAPPPQKFSSSKSLARELNRIQSTAKRLVKNYLKNIYTVIAYITKHPQNVMSELGKIMSRSTDMFKSLIVLCDDDYTILVSKMKDIDYSEYNQRVQEHVEQLKEDQDRVSNFYKIAKGKADSGVLKFKEKTPSKISTLKSRARGG